MDILEAKFYISKKDVDELMNFVAVAVDGYTTVNGALSYVAEVTMTDLYDVCVHFRFKSADDFKFLAPLTLEGFLFSDEFHPIFKISYED